MENKKLHLFTPPLLWPECLCAPKIHMLKSQPLKIMVLMCGAFGKYLGHKDGALMNEVNALVKGTTQSSLAPSARRGHSQKALTMNQVQGPQKSIIILGTFILDFLTSRTMGSKCLHQSEQAKTTTYLIRKLFKYRKGDKNFTQF